MEVSEGSAVLLRSVCGDIKIVRLDCLAATANGESAKQFVRVGKTKIDLKTLIGTTFGSTMTMGEDGKWHRVQRSEVMASHEPAGDDGAVDSEGASQSSDGEEKNSTEEGQNERSVAPVSVNESIGLKRALQSASKNESFHKKTKFAQEKYLRKKHKKFSREVTILKPSLADFCEANPAVIRWDMLGSLIRYAGLVKEGTNCAVVDDGMGIATTALLQRGCHVDRYVVDRFTGQAKALCLFGLDKSPMMRSFNSLENLNDKNYHVLVILHSGMCSLSVDAMFDALAPRICGGGRFAIYSRNFEPVLDLYKRLRTNKEENDTQSNSTKFIHIQLSEQMMREHQILPDRTHPIMQSGLNLFQGWILSGIRVIE